LEAQVSPGLSDCLHGTIAWRDVIQPTRIPNLDLLARGKTSRHAGELLLGPATEVLLQESIAEYDLVLWDTAPLFAVHDAANLCAKVDGVLFMARVRHSTVHMIQAALENLEQRNANIFGIVLNAVVPGQLGYYKKYRYKEYGTMLAEV
jgi:Mrp family chromosome partitioning ATPase